MLASIEHELSLKVTGLGAYAPEVFVVSPWAIVAYLEGRSVYDIP